MEINCVLTVALTMLCFQHGLMQTVTNPIKDAIEDDGVIQNEMKISTKNPKHYATYLNKTLKSNESDYLLNQGVTESVKPNSIKFQKKKKGRLLRRKFLKKTFKPSKHLYKKNYHDANMAYPIPTLQQEIFPSDNISINSNSVIPEFSEFNEEQGLIDYFANKLATYSEPSLFSEDMYSNNAQNNQNHIVERNQYNRTNTIQPQSYIDPLAEKRTPKRFFGGFLSGAVTVLEAAIKVNIPIPFCQFPNSPCKINFMK